MVGLWTGITRFRWTPLLAGLAALLAACLLWQWHEQVESRNRISTQLDLVMIADSLRYLSADSVTAVSPDSLTNLDAHNLYELLSATNTGSFLLEHQKDWDQRRELVDAWQRPFHIQLVYPAAHPQGSNGDSSAKIPPMVRIKIWSTGPDGKNDQGAGDDIASEVVAIKLRQ